MTVTAEQLLAAEPSAPTSVTMFGHTLSIWTDVAVVAVFTALFFGLAVRGFNRTG